MNKTTNYQLNQWERSDRVLMEDFNADNAKIDAALKAVDRKADGKASQSALDALGQTVAGKAELVLGTYTGDGEASQFISLGFTPKAVYVACDGTTFFVRGGGREYYGGLALEGHPCVAQESGAKMIEIAEGGMNVYHSLKNGVYAYLNENNSKYLYVALK